MTPAATPLERSFSDVLVVQRMLLMEENEVGRRAGLQGLPPASHEIADTGTNRDLGMGAQMGGARDCLHQLACSSPKRTEAAGVALTISTTKPDTRGCRTRAGWGWG